ncbi:hypothetical protein APV28_4505 [Comamonas testosteroni]|nr:hypothetical protein APV28_4505 [Comamonas testosteroni]
MADRRSHRPANRRFALETRCEAAGSTSRTTRLRNDVSRSVCAAPS